MIPHSAGSILQNKERIKRVIFQNKKWDAEWFFKLKKKKWDYSSKFEENFKGSIVDALSPLVVTMNMPHSRRLSNGGVLPIMGVLLIQLCSSSVL
jgi:ADP-heptose:LPS heptosyltransferase